MCSVSDHCYTPSLIGIVHQAIIVILLKFLMCLSGEFSQITGTYSHDKLSLKQDEIATRWQGTYKEKGQLQLEPKVGEKMNTIGVVTL